ncbi:1,4-dihydroxy-2-naphthoate polyprenyltransferase [Arenivirga flava]|uniref:1,4-dihydroxy-2-naphthoate polyprenyltransferase n=1 Tax=Arenivirga flava TaxID=1930060 RepID=UPI003D66E59B
MAQKQTKKPKGNPSKSGNPALRGRIEQGAPPRRDANARDWIAGARLRTLPLAIAPVALGTSAAYVANSFVWSLENRVIAALCLVLALFLQIGVNYANDYSDGVRGTDRHRVGPGRLVGSQLAKPRTVLTVALVFFALAAAAGVAITVLSGHWWFLAVGAASIVAAWFYTGGKRPYGYMALGELFVFVFFGLVAVAGTTYAQADTVNFEAWALAVAAGSFATAVLLANNLRDIEQDREAGKRTLSVLIGSAATRALYGVLMALPYGVLVVLGFFYTGTGFVFFTLLLALPAIVITATARTARSSSWCSASRASRRSSGRSAPRRPSRSERDGITR